MGDYQYSATVERSGAGVSDVLNWSIEFGETDFIKINKVTGILTVSKVKDSEYIIIRVVSVADTTKSDSITVWIVEPIIYGTEFISFSYIEREKITLNVGV